MKFQSFLTGILFLVTVTTYLMWWLLLTECKCIEISGCQWGRCSCHVDRSSHHFPHLLPCHTWGRAIKGIWLPGGLRLHWPDSGSSGQQVFFMFRHFGFWPVCAWYWNLQEAEGAYIWGITILAFSMDTCELLCVCISSECNICSLNHSM